MNDEGVDNLHAVTDRFVSEERPALPTAARVTPLISKQLLIRDTQAGIPVHVNETLTRMVIDSNTSQSGTDSHLSALLERLVRKTFDRLLRETATLRTITDAMLHNPGFTAPVAASIKSEHSRLITEQANIDALSGSSSSYVPSAIE